MSLFHRISGAAMRLLVLAVLLLLAGSISYAASAERAADPGVSNDDTAIATPEADGDSYKRWHVFYADTSVKSATYRFLYDLSTRSRITGSYMYVGYINARRPFRFINLRRTAGTFVSPLPSHAERALFNIAEPEIPLNGGLSMGTDIGEIPRSAIPIRLIPTSKSNPSIKQLFNQKNKTHTYDLQMSVPEKRPALGRGRVRSERDSSAHLEADVFDIKKLRRNEGMLWKTIITAGRSS